jgi:nitroreductase
MNPKLSFLFARRSIRRYADKPVGAEIIRDLLEAAMAAPSACACDPWHFIVLKSPELRRRVAECLPYGKMLGQAGAGVIVCGDLEAAHGKELSYLLQDCSAAIENLLVAASALGLGACWLGVHPRPERVEHIRKLFDLPANIIPVAAIALGWPAEKQAARTRFEKSAAHFDRW